MGADKPNAAANLIAESSRNWLAAWLQPLSAIGAWNAYWSRQWTAWLTALTAAPNPWLPALIDERRGQPAAIDFFLPWLPRSDAEPAPLTGIPEKDAARVMMRAVLPHVGPVAVATVPQAAAADSKAPTSDGKDGVMHAELNHDARAIVDEEGISVATPARRRGRKVPK